MYVRMMYYLLIITELLLLLDTNYFLMLYYVYFCERTLENQKTTAIVIRLWPKNLNKNTLNKKNNITSDSIFILATSLGSFMNVRSQLIGGTHKKRKRLRWHIGFEWMGNQITKSRNSRKFNHPMTDQQRFTWLIIFWFCSSGDTKWWRMPIRVFVMGWQRAATWR